MPTIDELRARREKRNAARDAQVGDLNRSLSIGLSRNPEEFVRDQKAANELGMPIEAVEGARHELEYDRRMHELDTQSMVHSAPATARSLSDPDIASIAHDDVENMWLYERFWAELGQRYKRGQDIVELGNLGRRAALGLASDEEELRIRILQSREMNDYGIADDGVVGFFAGVPGATAEMLPMAFDSIKHRVVVGGAAAGTGALVTGGAGTVAAPLTFAGGQAVGGFVSAFDTEFGNAYLELREVEGVDPQLAVALAMGTGTINGLLEGTGMGMLFKNVPGVGSIVRSGSREGMKRLLAEPLMKGTFTRAGEIIARGGATEFATEMAQELTLIGATLIELQTTGKGLNDFTVTTRDEHGRIVTLKGLPAVWKRAFDAGIQGAQGGTGIATAGQVGSGARAIAGQAADPIFQRVRDIVGESKLRERDPEAYRRFVRHQIDAEDSVLPENVSIRAEGIRRFLGQPDDSGDGDGDQAANREALEAAIRAWPELQHEIDQAFVAGTDVTIPFDVYEAYMAGEEFANALLPDTAYFDEETANEMAEREAELDGMPLADVAEEIAVSRTDREAERVLRTVLEQEFERVASGGVVTPQVDLFVSVMRSQASRRGLSLREWLTQEGVLRVEGPDAPVRDAAQPGLEERLRDERLRALVANLRSGEVPSVPRGTPIVDMLLAAGGVDPDSTLGGELRNLGIPTSGPGTRPGFFTRRGHRVIQPDGTRSATERRPPLRDMDNLVASEHPEIAAIVGEADGYLSRDGLLEELGNELRGESRIVVDHEAEQEALDLQQEQDAIETVIESLGLAFDEMSDEAIVERLIQDEEGDVSDFEPPAPDPRERRSLRQESFNFDQAEGGKTVAKIVDQLNPRRQLELDVHRELYLDATLEELSEDELSELYEERRQTLRDFQRELGRNKKLAKDPNFRAGMIAAQDEFMAATLEEDRRFLIEDKTANEILVDVQRNMIGNTNYARMWMWLVKAEAEREGGEFESDVQKAIDLWTEKYPDAATLLDIDRTELEKGEQEVRVAPGTQMTLFSEGRGEISFDPETIRDVVIKFTEAADLSTLLHEGWHLWTLQLERDASVEGAPAGLVNDWNLLREWLGKAEGETLTDADYERLARAGEAYLREGKAPSVGLLGAFDQFMSWLVNVYRKLRFRGYFDEAVLDDSIRGVFDRIVATDQEIEEARSSMGLGIFPENLSEYMTPDEQARFEESLTEARNAGKRPLRRKLVAAEEQKSRKDWREKRRAMEAEVTAEVDNDPIYQVRHWLAFGAFREGAERDVGPLEHRKLDRSALVRLKGEEILRLIPREGARTIVTRRNGLHPELVADVFGFDSAEQMLDAIISAPSRKDAIAERTDQRMEERFGIFKDEAALQEAVNEAALNGRELEVLANEERAYGRRTGNGATPLWLVRRIASANVGRMTVARAQPHLFRRAMARSARQKVLLAEAGDVEGAQRAVRQQMFAMAMEAELRKRMTAADKSYRYFQKVQRKNKKKRIVKAGGTFWEQIHGLLSRYEFARVSGVRLKKRASLAQFIERMESEGNDVLITEKMRNEADAHNWKLLTFNELEGLDAAVRNIEHLALRKLQLMVGSEHRAIENIVTELQVEAEMNIDARFEREAREKGLLAKTWKEYGLPTTAMMDKMEFLVDRLDGRKPNGPWRRYVWQPLREAELQRNEWNAAYTLKFAELLDELTAGRAEEYRTTKYHRELESKDLDGSASKMRLLGIALNLGNEGNKRRLLRGEGWSEKRLMSVLEREFRPEDWKFVQDVWDLMDTLWPHIVEQEKRLTGVIPKRVDRLVFETPDGQTMHGGYMPIVYDPRRSRAKQLVQERSESVFGQVESQMSRPMTGHSYINERGQGLDAPLVHDVGLVLQHIDRVILDLTHRETLLRVDRILQDDGLQQSLNERIGVDKVDMFRPWLLHIARHSFYDVKHMSLPEKIFRRMRVNQTTYILGWRDTTLAIQAAGHSNSIGMMRQRFKGEDWVPFYLQAVKDTMGSLADSAKDRSFMQLGLLYEDIAHLSSFMRDRPGFIDRDYRDAISDLSTPLPSLQGVTSEDAVQALKHGREARKFSMLMIAYTQLYTVDIPTWLAAYNAGLELRGMTQEQAVDFADSMVSMSQGSAGPMDQNHAQRANEGYRAFTLYASYAMTVYAQLQATVQDFRQGDASVTDLLAAGMFYIMLPASLSAAVRSALTGKNQLPDEDDNLFAWFVGVGLSELAGTFPFLRSLGGIAIEATSSNGRYYPERIPLQRLIDQVRDVARPQGVGEFTFDVIRLGGMLTGLPVAQLSTRVEDFLLED